MAKGKAITLRYQHDHIEDAVIVFSCEECSVFLIHSLKSGLPVFVELAFHGTQCIRSARTDCTPAMGIYPEELGASFIVELTESNWPVEAHQSYVYATSSLKPRGRHFVVSNHDIFYEILADSFVESLIGPDDKKHGLVKGLFNL